MEKWHYEFSAKKGKRNDPDKRRRGLILAARAYFDRAVSTLKDDEDVVISLSKPVARRTLAQNRGLWGPIYDQMVLQLNERLDRIADETGVHRGDRVSKELMHEGLLLEYGSVVDPVTGRTVPKKRTSDMTVGEMNDFYDWLAMYCAETLGIVITLPGEL